MIQCFFFSYFLDATIYYFKSFLYIFRRNILNIRTPLVLYMCREISSTRGVRHKFFFFFHSLTLLVCEKNFSSYQCSKETKRKCNCNTIVVSLTLTRCFFIFRFFLHAHRVKYNIVHFLWHHLVALSFFSEVKQKLNVEEE